MASYLPAVSLSEPTYHGELIQMEADGIQVHYDPRLAAKELTVIMEMVYFKPILAIKENAALLHR